MSVIALAGLAGCGQGSNNSGSGSGGKKQEGTLTILAASSLIDAFGELGKTFEKQNEGVTVKQSFESSSTLLTQIQQGAPADVFASAAMEEMDMAVEDGLVAGKPQVFVKNREIIMAPKNTPAGITEFQEVPTPGVNLALAQEDVPAADYARQIMDKANAS